MIEFMIKATREAKQVTSWTNPNSAYETRLANFVRHALDPRHGFIDDFKVAIDPLIRAGAASSLVQTVLKVFAPGVPDIYQGSELWDLSLVDPDNRRPIDFEKRQTLLRHLKNETSLDEHSWRDGSLKLALLRRSLAMRSEIDFTLASYEPLQVVGGDHARCISFLRREGKKAFVIIGALASAEHYQRTSGFGFDATPWRDTKITLPAGVAKHNFVDAFTRTIVPVNGETIGVAASLRRLPIAVLHYA
jgi:(1->4)-alpha-D-glucan 1-alpha-D-glucosylmutase